MNENTDRQDKLTLDDLDRFLSVQPAEVGLDNYLRSAAVLSAFDPFKLNPTGGDSSPEAREKLLGCLLPLCEPVNQRTDHGLWALSLPHRREALRGLATRESMKTALKSNPNRPDTPLQRMFERLLDAEPLKLDSLTRDELAAVLEAVEWVEDILDDLPKQMSVRRALAQSDLLAPMRRLAGHGFVGRESELEQLHQYVFGPKPDVPLFVFGTGGVGKSTLLARFILTHAVPQDIAISYVDIDRPVIRADRPLTLLLELIKQLSPQLDISASTAESLLKEVTSALSRYEEGRAFESVHAGDSWLLPIFGDNVEQWLQGRTALLIVDTLEEAQFLGSDVMWPLINFLLEMNRSLGALRIILSGRTLPREYAEQALHSPFSGEQDKVEDPAFLSQIPLPNRPVNLGVLEQAPALQLLRSELEKAAPLSISDEELKDVIGLVGRNPMCLKLAARLLEEEGVEKIRTERSELFAKLKAEKIQALLYGRILRHLHNEDVRKVAYPGLIVRRIDADVIREVLAEPCGLKLSAERNENDIFDDLRKEAALVFTDPEDYSLRHRADVRRSMLEDLTDHVDASVVEKIDRRAAHFYRDREGDVARAEEMYHLLRLGESESVLNSHWNPVAAARLQGALDELAPQQRLWLAEHLNVTLHESVREAASQETWESQAERSANRYLRSRLPEKALDVLHERKTRSPRSRLYSLEVESYRFLERYEEALAVARAGVEAASKAGAIDMALDLLLMMVVIEEAREHLKEAEALLHEAAAVSAHSSNKILQLRVQITGLRLQRQLRPSARDERAALRKDVQRTLNDEMLRLLRDSPVLLREVAAELGKQDARITSAALETLGVEVSTDAQAQAFGDAVTNLGKADPKFYQTVVRGMTDSQQDSSNPNVIRKWATEVLTSRDTRTLSNTLASAKAGSKVLSGFREYFRAGVTSALKGKSTGM